VEGLEIDARTAWDYVCTKLQQQGTKRTEDQIILVGQSLGTGVVSHLARDLAKEGKSASQWLEEIVY